MRNIGIYNMEHKFAIVKLESDYFEFANAVGLDPDNIETLKSYYGESAEFVEKCNDEIQICNC